MSEKEAVVKLGPSALARPEFVKPGDVRGAETITRDDLQMPRLALAQALSPELDPSSPRYIEGLKVGDAFNNLTGLVYGKAPIEVVVVRVDRPRYVEFNPREAGGGIRDFNVPANDPRTAFGPNGEKPVATKFMEAVALLVPSLEPIALSFKGSGLKTARQLNGLIKMRALPSFATVYSLTPTVMKNPLGAFSVFVVKQVRNVTADEYAYASDVFESIRDRVIAVDREPGQDDEA
jgi:hypothetical protein